MTNKKIRIDNGYTITKKVIINMALLGVCMGLIGCDTNPPSKPDFPQNQVVPISTRLTQFLKESEIDGIVLIGRKRGIEFVTQDGAISETCATTNKNGELVLTDETKCNFTGRLASVTTIAITEVRASNHRSCTVGIKTYPC